MYANLGRHTNASLWVGSTYSEGLDRFGPQIELLPNNDAQCSAHFRRSQDRSRAFQWSKDIPCRSKYSRSIPLRVGNSPQVHKRATKGLTAPAKTTSSMSSIPVRLDQLNLLECSGECASSCRSQRNKCFVPSATLIFCK